ncbi:hypothetical protein ACRTEV_12920 [Rossellomorea arthrocnemi]
MTREEIQKVEEYIIRKGTESSFLFCLEADEEEDDLVRQAVTIIEAQLEGKSFK